MIHDDPLSKNKTITDIQEQQDTLAFYKAFSMENSFPRAASPCAALCLKETCYYFGNVNRSNIKPLRKSLRIGSLEFTQNKTTNFSQDEAPFWKVKEFTEGGKAVGHHLSTPKYDAEGKRSQPRVKIKSVNM